MFLAFSVFDGGFCGLPCPVVFDAFVRGIRAWILGLGGILRRFPARFKHKRIRMAVWAWNGCFGLLWGLKRQNKGGVEGILVEK